MRDLDFHRHMLSDLATIRRLMEEDRRRALEGVRIMQAHHQANLTQCGTLHRLHHEPIHGHLGRIANRGPFRGR